MTIRQDRATAACQAFLTDAKLYWMNEIFQDLRRDYERWRAGRPLATPEDVAATMAESPLYPYFAWLERHIQKEKVSGRWGLARHVAAHREELLARLATADDDAERLELDPDLEIPEWYTAIDTHQIPGNLHGDALAGVLYKSLAASTQPGATGQYALHERFAEFCAARGDFRRILDEGCGFGKSAITLAQRFTEAEVDGIDLSAPCLRLAALEAAEAQTRNLRYRQMDLTRTDYDDGAFDLVTSTMTLHEMPPDAIETQIAESYRLLEPGGLAIHLDFRSSEPFEQFIHHSHGLRNNEPYMEPFNRMDVVAAYRSAGFADVESVDFEERAGAIADRGRTWRFPWAAVIARKAA